MSTKLGDLEVSNDLLLKIYKHNNEHFTLVPEKYLTKKDFKIITKMLKECIKK